MTIHIPLLFFQKGADAIDMAARIASQTGGILVAGNRALIVRPARNARETATMAHLRRVLANTPPEAA